jgi:hypothetical protein
MVIAGGLAQAMMLPVIGVSTSHLRHRTTRGYRALALGDTRVVVRDGGDCG